MKQALKIVLTSALITAAVIKAAPAFAEPVASGAPAVTIVHTADLDLSGDDGRRQLELRLAQAAREVCGSASDSDLKGKNDVRQCRTEVLSSARRDRDELLAGFDPDGTIAVAAIR